MVFVSLSFPKFAHLPRYCYFFFFCGAATQRGSWPPHSWGSIDHAQWCTTVGRIPLDEWSVHRRDLYLTAHNIHNRQISMPPGGIRTHDLSRRAAADLCLRPCGHWDRHIISTYTTQISHLSNLLNFRWNVQDKGFRSWVQQLPWSLLHIICNILNIYKW